MIVRTPWPSGPTRSAKAERKATSDEAFERLPSLSLSRAKKIAFLAPSGEIAASGGRQPARRLREHEKGVAIGADMNHLDPVIA